MTKKYDGRTPIIVTGRERLCVIQTHTYGTAIIDLIRVFFNTVLLCLVTEGTLKGVEALTFGGRRIGPHASEKKHPPSLVSDRSETEFSTS